MAATATSDKYWRLVQTLEDITRNPPTELLQDDSLRTRLLRALQGVVPEIEKPNDTTQRVLYSALTNMAAMIGVQSHTFEILSSSKTPLTTEELSQQIGAEPAMLERLLKFLASLSMVKEVDMSLWSASKISGTLANPGIAAGIFHNHVTLGPVWQAFPSFLEKTKYQTMSDPRTCVFSDSHDGQALFDWFEQNPINARFFNAWMTQQRFGQAQWLDGFPFQDIVGKGSDATKPLFVDVGGGIGHQCQALLSRFPDLAGRVVLQDQPSVLAEALQIEGVESVPLDFFTEQPVPDWPGDKCQIILSHLKKAMSLDSILLIDEMVVPTNGANKISMQIDMTIYVSCGAGERTEKQWNEVLNAAGFRIESVWAYHDELNDSIIVALPQ
ncbi:MAG: hypothetical protein M1820_002021 [Bogoriella megaspora]|nr:MAG: hypothetical protein M1820_002021 [Bogoriella megaspora]